MFYMEGVRNGLTLATTLKNRVTKTVKTVARAGKVKDLKAAVGL